jgi:hypothetical protein
MNYKGDRLVTSATTAHILGLGELQLRQIVEAHLLQHVKCVLVDLDRVLLGDDRHFRCVIVALFTFFFLQLDRNALDWSALDTLHQTSDVTGDLVSHALGRDFGDVIADTLV